MRRLLLALTIAGLLAGGGLVGGSSSVASPSASPKWVKTAKTRLLKLDERAPASMSGYSRSRFGPAWEDVDVNGCDTRNDILARDLKQVVYRAGSDCVVAKGTLRDPYTATTIAFVRGKSTSSKVQIDHVVALAAAWRTGAKRWRAELRLFYANDPLVLLAVDGPTNGAKGDKDADDWLPPNAGFHCRYVARQIAVKTKYELWVTQPERTKMAETLGGC